MNEEQRSKLNAIEDAIRILSFRVKLLDEKMDREYPKKEKDEDEDFGKLY